MTNRQEGYPVPDRRGPFEKITPRRFQCIWLRIRHGLPNQRIADELGLRPSTVASYIKTACPQLGVQGAAGLGPLVWEYYSDDPDDPEATRLAS